MARAHLIPHVDVGEMCCMRIIRSIVLVAALGACASAPQQQLDPITAPVGAFVEQVRAEDNLPPGFAVIVTRGDQVVFEREYGVRDVTTGAPMTLDTPIVSDSISKSLVALMAARLDAEGVLSLDATLADVWPNLTLPAPLESSTVTVRRLLSRQSGMTDNWLDRTT